VQEAVQAVAHAASTAETLSGGKRKAKERVGERMREDQRVEEL